MQSAQAPERSRVVEVFDFFSDIQFTSRHDGGSSG
jgi:hypothetical protein